MNSKLSALWHGEVTKQSFSRAASSQVVTVPLVKNTNTIRIILQQMDGVTVEVDKFEFTITDDNGLMNYDNKLLEDETLTYYPYYRMQGGTDMGTRADGDAEGHEMTNQEYLDRQDEYNMTFFLDESMKWINTSIIINDWVVRFNELDM